LRDVRSLIVQVSDQNRLRWTDNDAGRLKSNVDAMRAEVTFFRGVIFGIDEDGVVRTGGHAGFATDANRFVEIDNAVSALEHRGRWTRSHARCVSALIATRDLVRAPHLGKHSYVYVLDVSPSDTDRHHVLGLARSRTRVTADAAGVIDNFRPLHAVASSWFWLDHFVWRVGGIYHEAGRSPAVFWGKLWKGRGFPHIGRRSRRLKMRVSYTILGQDRHSWRCQQKSLTPVRPTRYHVFGLSKGVNRLTAHSLGSCPLTSQAF
jgi:hypothetical protein